MKPKKKFRGHTKIMKYKIFKSHLPDRISSKYLRF